ncbi:MAG: TatD family hydrolase [Candidatus Thorarchaeota archaeon]|nr:TatD family hydrolase [Candidatus Thorarchaeota archaeon]
MESSDFDGDRAMVIRRAEESGIHVITSAIDPRDYDKALDIASAYNTVSLAVGLDPELVGQGADALEWIRRNRKSLIAIGETGLDHYRTRDHSVRALQEDLFKQFIAEATDAGLPIQVHSRSAGAKALDVLYRAGAEAVHMHAFDGRAGLARTASCEHGYYFSVPTSVVRSPQKRKLVEAVDIEHLLVETDSPVLGADPTRRNEPSDIDIAIDECARILGRHRDEMQDILLENTLRLYRSLVSKKSTS